MPSERSPLSARRLPCCVTCLVISSALCARRRTTCTCVALPSCSQAPKLGQVTSSQPSGFWQLQVDSGSGVLQLESGAGGLMGCTWGAPFISISVAPVALLRTQATVNLSVGLNANHLHRAQAVDPACRQQGRGCQSAEKHGRCEVPQKHVCCSRHGQLHGAAHALIHKVDQYCGVRSLYW